MSDKGGRWGDTAYAGPDRERATNVVTIEERMVPWSCYDADFVAW